MSVELERLALQQSLDKAKTALERNKLGQFATPTLLASELLQFTRSLITSDQPIRFLDPAIGTGAFYSAFCREFDSANNEEAVGFEIDPHYGGPAKTLWKDHPLNIRMEDFTTATFPRETDQYNLIVCNPPYVRHHHLASKTKEILAEKTALAAGFSMNGLAGLYCYFIAISHAWLSNGGIACWLVPSEFMDVNYGIALKRYLAESVELIRIHRYDPSELQFGDALVSSAVLFFRKKLPRPDHQIEFSFGGTLSKPAVATHISVQQLVHAPKWSRLAQYGIKPRHQGLVLSDYFSIKRGIATGDNSFFIMSEEQAEQLEIPKQFLKPVLPGPRYLETDLVEAENDGTPKVHRRLFMLDCPLPEEEVRAIYPKLWQYLETGRLSAGQSYLSSRRTPWYVQESRKPAPFICTYMGRNLGAKRSKPFRFILNRSDAVASNVYLMLYPKGALLKALTASPELDIAVWNFLNSIHADALLGEGRVYGGGLYKMEPAELANVPADSLEMLLPSDIHKPFSQSEMFRGQVA